MTLLLYVYFNVAFWNARDVWSKATKLGLVLLLDSGGEQFYSLYILVASLSVPAHNWLSPRKRCAALNRVCAQEKAETDFASFCINLNAEGGKPEALVAGDFSLTCSAGCHSSEAG